MGKSTFSVNFALTDRDIFELRKELIESIKKRAEASVVKWYRPGESKSKRGVLIGKDCVVGEPEPEKISALLDAIKSAQDIGEDTKAVERMVIPMPII